MIGAKIIRVKVCDKVIPEMLALMEGIDKLVSSNGSEFHKRGMRWK